MTRPTTPRGAAPGAATPTSASTPATRDSGHGLVRTTVNLIWAAAEILDRLSRTTGYSKTDIINQSIKLRGAVQDRIDRGGELYMIYPDGKTEVFVL